MWIVVFIFCRTHVKTHNLFLPVDRLEHCLTGQLERGCEYGCWQACSCMLEQTVYGLMNEQPDLNNVVVVGAIMINQQPCSYLIEHVARNDEITRLNSDVTNIHNLVVASSRVSHVLTITYTNNVCRFAKLYAIY